MFLSFLATQIDMRRPVLLTLHMIMPVSRRLFQFDYEIASCYAMIKNVSSLFTQYGDERADFVIIP